jgi:exodeoxyribonuclease V alpha subunit
LDYEAQTSVEGFIESIIFRNDDNGYTVFSIVFNGEEVTCVGTLSYVSAGEYIVAQGAFVKHPVYYMQFSIQSYEFKAPEDSKSVRRYLSSGSIKGIGEKLADRIVDTFGDETFRIMEEEPERLSEIKGITLKKAMDIAGQLVEKRDMRNAMMYMQDLGISMKLANKVFLHYGQDVYTVIRDNPYRLADDIDGVGFHIADEIARKAGFAANSEFRVKSGILYCLGQAVAQGHVYLPSEMLYEQAKDLLLVEISEYDKYIMDMALDRKIVVKTLDGRQCVYPSRYYYMEMGVARKLNELDVEYTCDETQLNERIDAIEQELSITLDDIQRNAVKSAVLNGLMVITGGPGTGKTTTINTIIRFFQMEGMDIRLAAPTGRAAKRMSETCGFEAQTIHRLLEINKAPDDDSSSLSFERNEDNPLETDVIIVDEMSMVDVAIMNSLLKAVPVGTRLILVGDVDQLPSVGAGNVLKDIIHSERFPVVKLEKIFRQAAESEIVTNAHKINKGETVQLNKYSKDFLFVRRNTPDEIIGAMCTLLKAKLPSYVNADINEIQILTPSRKSAVGVERLNACLQQYLNPPANGKQERMVGNVVFREGDKVMQIKNDYQLEWEKRNRYGVAVEMGTGVYNGDTGVIQRIDTFSEALTVRFEDGREVSYEFKQLEELELAYAVTVHKSQGSEYPAVIIPMYPGPRMLMNRNLLYTAVTRAKKCVCMVGMEEVFHSMAANESEQQRFSSLDVRIKEISG